MYWNSSSNVIVTCTRSISQASPVCRFSFQAAAQRYFSVYRFVHEDACASGPKKDNQSGAFLCLTEGYVIYVLANPS